MLENVPMYIYTTGIQLLLYCIDNDGHTDQELENRLRARGTETEESLAKRLGAAAEEME